MKEYGDLGNVDKIRAILAALEEPVVESKFYDLAGIDSESLSPDERQLIAEVFANVIADEKDPIGSQRFWYPLERRKAVFTELDVDPKTVHGQIADVSIKNLGYQF